jgi:hypothetical protein
MNKMWKSLASNTCREVTGSTSVPPFTYFPITAAAVAPVAAGGTAHASK